MPRNLAGRYSVVQQCNAALMVLSLPAAELVRRGNLQSGRGLSYYSLRALPDTLESLPHLQGGRGLCESTCTCIGRSFLDQFHLVSRGDQDSTLFNLFKHQSSSGQSFGESGRPRKTQEPNQCFLQLRQLPLRVEGVVFSPSLPNCAE